MTTVVDPTRGGGDEEEDAANNEKETVEDNENQGEANSTAEPPPSQCPSPNNNKGLLLGALLLSLIAIVVVPLAVVLPKEKDDEANVAFSPIYNITEDSALPPYNENILQEYDTLEQFDHDFVIASQYFINSIAARASTGQYYHGGGPTNGGRGCRGCEVDVADGAPQADVSAPAGSPTNSEPEPNVDDFGTNNQEIGIEEGDYVVASKKAVYAAYGPYIVSWNATSGERFQSFRIQNDIWEEAWISINTLLLHENQLLAVVGGNFDAERHSTERVLGSYLRTRVFVFDVGPDGTDLELVKQKDINGYFTAVRAEGGKTHIVTMSDIRMDSVFAPLELWNSQWTESRRENVRREADTSLIPGLIDRIKDELTVDGAFPRTVRLSRWQTETSEHSMGDVVYGGYTNSVALVTSFDLSAVSSDALSTEFVTSTTAIFLPTWGGEVYATASMLLIATSGYDFSPSRDAMIEQTYLVALSLQDSTSRPHAIGTVEGYFLNQRSFDINAGSLRVATSIRNLWFWSGFDGVNQRSTTENYIYSLDLPSPTSDKTHVLNELDRVKLGKPNELFTAVRFFDEVAYAVTFERTDPFYVLDVSDPENFIVLAEVEITGFSTYLHSMNDENCLILAIGEEATEQGRTLGLQVSVFDTCDIGNISVVRHTLETSENVYSSSDASWDVKAVRFNQETGRLIIPVDIYSWENEAESFHGFKVYTAAADSITEDCRIETGSETSDGDYCFSCGGQLPTRSMIFGGDLTTTKARFITSTDLNTCDQIWQFRVEDAIEYSGQDGCCGYYW